jgi:Kef-type K+ transport system membrane component KefB
VLGLLVLAGVTGVAEGGFDPLRLIGTAALAFGFVAAVAFIGAPLMTRAAPHLKRLHQDNEFFIIAILLCFGLALAATAIGVAAIIGAFLAGLALAEAAESRHDVHEQIRGVTEFTVPFFLVGIGLQLDLHAFSDPGTIKLALALTGIAVLTKLVGCGLGVARAGWRTALQVGVGMIPRGEVGIVVAQMGLTLGVIDAKLFGATLFMACATTLIAPPLIQVLFRKQSPAIGAVAENRS